MRKGMDSRWGPYFLKGKWTCELYCNFLVVYRISNVNEQLAKLKPTCRWWMLNFHGRWQNNFTHYLTLRVPYLIFWFSKNMLLLSSLSYPRSYLEDVRSCCLVIRKAQALPSKVSKFQSCTFVTGCLRYLLDFMIFYPYLGVYAVAKNTKQMTFSTFMSSRWSVKACLLGGKLPSFPFIPRCSYWWCTILIIL